MSKLMIIPEKPCYIAGAAALPLSAAEPDYKPVITDANLRRRMGRLLKMSVYCGLQALGDVASEEVAGTVTFTGMGFMKDTVSFGNSIYDRDEELLNPSPFMQSTFNTASGYIALIRKIRSYNTTYVQHASGFMASFADAVMLLDEHQGQHVLVGGFDEITPEVDVLRRRLGLYRADNGDFMPLGEGAGALLLSSAGGSARILGMAPASCPVDEFVSACAGHGTVYDTVRCSGLVSEYGAFGSMLPVIIADRLSTNGSGPMTLYVDDVNPDGVMALISNDFAL